MAAALLVEVLGVAPLPLPVFFPFFFDEVGGLEGLGLFDVGLVGVSLAVVELPSPPLVPGRVFLRDRNGGLFTGLITMMVDKIMAT